VPTYGFAFDFGFSLFTPLSATEYRLVRGSPTNMFEHVTAQRVVRVYEEA